jgi:hypothetical protein
MIAIFYTNFILLFEDRLFQLKLREAQTNKIQSTKIEYVSVANKKDNVWWRNYNSQSPSEPMIEVWVQSVQPT